MKENKDPSKIDDFNKAATKLNKMTINSAILIIGISILGLIVVIGASMISKNLWMGIIGCFIFTALLVFGYFLITLGKKGEQKITQNIGAKIAKTKEKEEENKHAQFIGRYSGEHKSREHSKKHPKRKYSSDTHSTHTTQNITHRTHKKHCTECGKIMVKTAKYCPECGTRQE